MRRLVTVAAILVGVVALSSLPAIAEPLEGTLKGQSLAGHIQCPTGKLVINISEKVLQDADSGFGGAWAFDEYVRQIQVVQVSDETFCATVNYTGSFTTVAGTSPSGLATVGVDVVGHFDGGYVTTNFTGVLNSNPTIGGSSVRAKGSIGTIDYRCDINFNCPGYVNWVTTYFSTSSGFDLANWGWTYHTSSNGTWVNAHSGSVGDITGL